MKKFQFACWLSPTGVGIVVLVLIGISCIKNLNSNGSRSLLHVTNDGEGCHLLSSYNEQTLSLFVFKRDPQSKFGMRQMYQIDIFNPHEDTSDIFETGEVSKATQCLKWASTDPETNDLPSNVRQILALRSQD